jgi:hypothetical protein
VGWKFLRGSGESSKSGSGAVFCVSVRWRRSGVNASGGGGGCDEGKELKALRDAGWGGTGGMGTMSLAGKVPTILVS